MKSKNYNPLKMWGSYVGAIILGIFTFLTFRGYSPIFNLPDILPPYAEFCEAGMTGCGWLHGQLDSVIYMAIIGFLLGYGIHSLVRAIRK